MSTRMVLSKLIRIAIRKAHETCKSRGIELDLGRRGFGTALLAAVGGGLLLRTADAFPRDADADFRRATKILTPYGLSVDGAFDQTLGHDVLAVTSVPNLETQYDFVVGQVNTAGTINPCVKTVSFQGTAEFISFDENPAGGILPCTKTMVSPSLTTFEQLETNAAGGIVPCIKTSVGPSVTTFEQLDTNAVGGIIPCSKTTIDGADTTHELFDPNQAGGIIPCAIVGAERLSDGSLGPVEVTVNDPNLNFKVRIGPRTYRLVDGALVEETPR